MIGNQYLYCGSNNSPILIKSSSPMPKTMLESAFKNDSPQGKNWYKYSPKEKFVVLGWTYPQEMAKK